MCYPVLWNTGCRNQILCHAMSFTSIWSGNFQQLRNSLANSCSFKLLRFQSCVTSEKVVGNRRSGSRTITTKVVGRNQKPESNKPCYIDLKLLDGAIGSSVHLNTKKSVVCEFKEVHYCNIQENIVEGRISEWPAVVFVFDIETTGFSCQKERIIEIALRDLLGGRDSTFQTLVNPEKVILNSDIHGITTKMVNRPDVPRMRDLIPILIQYVRSRQIPGKPVLWVAHNARRFDVPFIINEFSRCSVEIPSDWFFVDTIPLGRQLVKPDGSKLASVSLRALSEHYEIPLMGQAHRAMQDVMTLSAVLQKMSFELKLSVAGLLERAFRASDVTKGSS